MRHNITKLVSISFIGGLIGRGVRYGFNIVIARGLGVEALGIFAFGMVLMKGGAVFSRIGLDSAVQKFVPIYRNQNDSAKVSGTVIVGLIAPFFVGSVVAVILYLGFGFISSFTSRPIHPSSRLFLIGIPIFATMMVGVNSTYALKHTKYSVYIRDIGQSIMALVFIGIAAFVFSDFDLVVIGYILSFVFGVFITAISLTHLGAIRFDVRPKFEYKKVLTFALPLTFAASIQYLVSWTDILVLGVYVPSKEVGWYQAAFQTSVLLTIVLQSANSIFPTIAADLYEAGDQKQLSRVYTATTRWVTYFTIMGLLFVIINNNTVLSIFGATTPQAQAALVILAIGQTITATVGPTGYLLVMSGYERLQLVNNSISAALNLVLNIILIQKFGIIGAAAATGISLATLNILRLIESWYFLRMQPYSWAYLRGGFAIFAGLTVLLTGRYLSFTEIHSVFITGILSLTVFGLVMWKIGFDEIDQALFEPLLD